MFGAQNVPRNTGPLPRRPVYCARAVNRRGPWRVWVHCVWTSHSPQGSDSPMLSSVTASDYATSESLENAKCGQPIRRKRLLQGEADHSLTWPNQGELMDAGTAR